MMGASRRGERERGKSDQIDAQAVARAVVKDGVERFPAAYLDERAMEIRLLFDHRDGRTFLEQGVHARRIPGDGRWRDRHPRLLFLQDSRELRWGGSVRAGGDWYDRGLAAGKAKRPSSGCVARCWKSEFQGVLKGQGFSRAVRVLYSCHFERASAREASFLTKTIRISFLSFALFLAAGLWAQDTPVYFAPDPGAAKVEVGSSGFSISNF